MQGDIQTQKNHSKWFLPYFRENLIPSLLTTTLTTPSPLFTPALLPSSLILPSQPLNNLHPEVKKQLDNKGSLKGHTPTMFMLASLEQPWNWTVKRTVVLLAGQVSVSTFISGCHSQNGFRTVWGRHCVCLCVSMARCIQEAWVWGLLRYRSITQFLQTSC